jgi:tRNA(Ile)-lysidine synthase
MYKRFIEFINQNGLLKKGDRVLLAISGGMDSMVMAELFSWSDFNFAMAHCNFQLRGKDADEDEAFVKKQASRLQVDFFSQKFNTAAYAAQEKSSIQMAARKLRYQWLEKTREQHGFHAVGTAHHFDDSVETLFINILRGTGVSGLKGIPKKNNKVIRPLLFTTREKIMEYVKQFNVSYREDASNLENKYLRNKLRHQLIPLLHDLNPYLDDNFQQFFDRMEITEAFYHKAIEHEKKAILRFYENEIQILISPLLKQPFAATILYEILKDYGFNPSQSLDIYNSLHAQPGKSFMSGSHNLVRDRNALIIFPERSSDILPEYSIQEDLNHLDCGTFIFRFYSGIIDNEFVMPKNPKTLAADMNKLHFPLTLRKWQPGDKLIPLGMKGHKKVSDLLIDNKIPFHKKKDVMVLLSDNEIIWVAGVHASEVFKITNQTTNYFMAEIQ